VTVISPVTSIPAPKSTLASKAEIFVWNKLPSTVEISNVLFGVYQSTPSTPATETSAAAVNRPSSSTVNVGIREAEPYEPAVTAVFASSVEIEIVPES